MTLPPPVFQAAAFTCPHCTAFANMSWPALPNGHPVYHTLHIAICAACQKYNLWFREQENADSRMVWPDTPDVPPPNSDLNDDITSDYREAASILNNSPRGAAALLRLCVQKICIALGLKGTDLNSDIADLVKRGLPPKGQQSLDAVRVIGNESVHISQNSYSD